MPGSIVVECERFVSVGLLELLEAWFMMKQALRSSCRISWSGLLLPQSSIMGHEGEEIRKCRATPWLEPVPPQPGLYQSSDPFLSCAPIMGTNACAFLGNWRLFSLPQTKLTHTSTGWPQLSTCRVVAGHQGGAEVATLPHLVISWHHAGGSPDDSAVA